MFFMPAGHDGGVGVAVVPEAGKLHGGVAISSTQNKRMYKGDFTIGLSSFSTWRTVLRDSLRLV